MHPLYCVCGLQVLSDEELVRTVFKDPRLDGRPDFNLRRVFNGHGKYYVDCRVYWRATDAASITKFK